MNLTNFIINYRTRNAMTQRELAKKIGITPVMLSIIENGRRHAGPSTLKKMSKYFNIDVIDLVEMNGGKYRVETDE